MDWLANNFPTLLIVLGIALLVIEVGLLGFSVFVLFFIGLACIVTGLIMMLGVFPETLAAAFGSVAILSVLFAVSLWTPLKKMQNSGGDHNVKGDFIGHSFVLEHAVSPTEFSSHKLSGIAWQVRSETPLAAGTHVEVVKVEVGMLTVAAKS
jgi:membrane protein implicated in regulation of membrane protease activity